jgi:hypothetical protein
VFDCLFCGRILSFVCEAWGVSERGEPEFSKYADWRQVAVSYYLLQDKKQRAEQECMFLCSDFRLLVLCCSDPFVFFI